MDAKDILLGLAGLVISLFGGYKKDMFTLVLGILLIILAIYLKLQEQEDDIDSLNNQINTQLEIQKIWREIDELKKVKKR